MDNLDRSYKIVKISSGLFVFALLYMIFVKPFLETTSLSGVSDLFIGLPFLACGAISIVGFYYALRGSQYGQRNAKKRFFGLFGNFVFAFMLIAMILAIATDLKKLLN